MRGIMLAIGLAFLSASFMAPARAAGPGETCVGIGALDLAAMMLEAANDG